MDVNAHLTHCRNQCTKSVYGSRRDLSVLGECGFPFFAQNFAIIIFSLFFVCCDFRKIHQLITLFSAGWWGLLSEGEHFTKSRRRHRFKQIMSPMLLSSSRPLLTALTKAALLKHDITVCWLTVLSPPHTHTTVWYSLLFGRPPHFEHILFNTSWSRQLMCMQNVSLFSVF